MPDERGGGAWIEGMYAPRRECYYKCIHYPTYDKGYTHAEMTISPSVAVSPSFRPSLLPSTLVTRARFSAASPPCAPRLTCPPGTPALLRSQFRLAAGVRAKALESREMWEEAEGRGGGGGGGGGGGAGGGGGGGGLD